MATPTSLFEITTIIPKIRFSINEFRICKRKCPPFRSTFLFLTRLQRRSKKLTSLYRLASIFHPTKAQIMEISTAGRRLVTLIRLPQMRLIPTQRMRLEPTRDRFERACGVMIGAIKWANSVIKP